MADIEWKRSARNELATIWSDASDRRSITDAVDRLDSTLGVVPREAGESRWGAARILFELPLGILFEVDANGAHVYMVGKVSPGRTPRLQK